MIALSNRARIFAAIWLVLGVIATACSVQSGVELARGACVQGQSEACGCDDGSLGVRICGADSEFATCQCGVSGGGGAGGAMQPVGGAAGSVVVDDGITAGAGADPNVDAGPAGSGGTSGSDDGGMVVGTGGVGGSGGIGGVGGEATGGSPVVEEVPAPGEAYGECRDDGSCDLPMFCAFDVLSGGERYCAAVCNGNGFGALGCPPRKDGSRGLCVGNLCTR